MVPMDRDILVNTEDVVPSLGPLCSDMDGRTFEKLDNAALLTGIAGLALRVSFSTLLISIVSMPCALFCLTLIFFPSLF